MNIYPVILAGGAGTRFWPASRATRPKQLLSLTGNRSMFEATVERLKKLFDPSSIRVLSPPHLRAPLAERAPELSENAFIDEPAPRDTAPCIGLAALQLREADPDAGMLVVPSDQFIHDEKEYIRSLSSAVRALERCPRTLFTFGVEPTEPATGFGYIRKGDRQFDLNGTGVYEVSSFREKPERETAVQYLEDGEYLWNAGMFVWRADVLLEQLQACDPEIFEGLITVREEGTDPERRRELFTRIPARSIDYAVMEKAEDVGVLESQFDWTDLGTWTSLDEVLPPDDDGNVVQGPSFLQDVEDCVVFNNRADGHLVACQHVRDLVVVHTDDATLVCPTDRDQDVKELVQALKRADLDEFV